VGVLIFIRGTKMADLLRAFGLAQAITGKPFYVSDESEQKTYVASVAPTGHSRTHGSLRNRVAKVSPRIPKEMSTSPPFKSMSTIRPANCLTQSTCQTVAQIWCLGAKTVELFSSWRAIHSMKYRHEPTDWSNSHLCDSEPTHISVTFAFASSMKSSTRLEVVASDELDLTRIDRRVRSMEL
jgi:hypothetical protein